MSLHERLAHELGMPVNVDDGTMLAIVRALRAQHGKGRKGASPYLKWYQYAVALSMEPMTASDLAADVGVSYQAADQWLRRARRMGYVKKHGTVHCLTESGLRKLRVDEKARERARREYENGQKKEEDGCRDDEAPRSVLRGAGQ